MKTALTDLAVRGGPCAFDQPLHVGQINVPSEARFREAFTKIFTSRRYTGGGPLREEFEDKLAKLLGVAHVIAISNATIGLMFACKALGLPQNRRVIVPAFTFAASVQALSWCGLTPEFCEVDPIRHHITRAIVAPLLERASEETKACAILGVHLWGIPCPVDDLAALAKKHGIPIFYDAAHAIGNFYNDTPIGNFGDLEVFSFHATKIMSCAEGGCITTNSDALAHEVRKLRGDSAVGGERAHPYTGGGDFSEAQAAIGLLSLEDFAENCASNETRLNLYQQRLGALPGLRFLPTPEKQQRNCQYVVFEVDEHAFGLSRNQLVEALEAENVLCRRYFTPGMHRCPPYVDAQGNPTVNLPVTDALSRQVMQLPSGQQMTPTMIEQVCDLVHFIHSNAAALRQHLAP